MLEKYPKRNLPNGAVVTRYAPSPTGFVHMGNVYAAFIERKMARQSNGVFYLRIEDTDQKRYVKDGIQRIIKDMKDFNHVKNSPVDYFLPGLIPRGLPRKGLRALER